MRKRGASNNKKKKKWHNWSSRIVVELYNIGILFLFTRDSRTNCWENHEILQAFEMENSCSSPPISFQFHQLNHPHIYIHIYCTILYSEIHRFDLTKSVLVSFLYNSLSSLNYIVLLYVYIYISDYYRL